ncbi:MAG: DUF4129 domain-containing protein [Acidimicrobiia bacterium]|nr:DUF4129 domain-containing protein [Acidimicrobiia bacterium]
MHPDRRRRQPPWQEPLAVAAARFAMVLVAVVAATLVTGTGAGALNLQQDGGDALVDPTAPADDVRDTARRILAEPPFVDLDVDETTGVDPRQGQREGTPGSDPQPPSFQPPVFEGLGALGQAIVWVVAALLAGAAVWLLLRVIAGWRRRTSTKADTIDDDVELRPVTVDDVEPDGDAETWLRRAEEHERAGRYRHAVRCRFRALVATLEDVGVLAGDATRTSGELRRELAGRAPDVTRSFGDVAERFDAAWYGAAPTTEADCTDVAAAAQQVMVLVERRPSTDVSDPSEPS